MRVLFASRARRVCPILTKRRVNLAGPSFSSLQGSTNFVTGRVQSLSQQIRIHGQFSRKIEKIGISTRHEDRRRATAQQTLLLVQKRSRAMYNDEQHDLAREGVVQYSEDRRNIGDQEKAFLSRGS